MDSFDPLTHDEQLIVDSVLRFLGEKGGECGDGGVGGGSGWPDNKVSCCNILQRTIAWCNSLQHTVTYCNTLSYTAAH